MLGLAGCGFSDAAASRRGPTFVGREMSRLGVVQCTYVQKRGVPQGPELCFPTHSGREAASDEME